MVGKINMSLKGALSLFFWGDPPHPSGRYFWVDVFPNFPFGEFFFGFLEGFLWLESLCNFCVLRNLFCGEKVMLRGNMFQSFFQTFWGKWWWLNLSFKLELKHRLSHHPIPKSWLGFHLQRFQTIEPNFPSPLKSVTSLEIVPYFIGGLGLNHGRE